jgi:lipopolysaccharide/colanic/teichoic acid biosynthesis glycosyltransferase
MKAQATTAEAPNRHSGELSYWNWSRGKRVLDLCVSLCLLTITFPLIVIVALIIKITSPGPAFFLQRRVGQDGCEFQIIKLRTMRCDGSAGPKVTRTGDLRITVVGKVLRKCKLDELPQLFNVVRGDMTLVGHRPDVAEYFDTLDASRRQVLRLRPGITGQASLEYRNEEELLSNVPGNELASFYCSTILPDKIDIDLAYARTASFQSDLKILVKTLAVLSR